MQAVHIFGTQFQNVWHITRLSVNKHRQVTKTQISMLNPLQSDVAEFRG